MNRALKTILVLLVVVFVGVAAFAGGVAVGNLIPGAQARSLVRGDPADPTASPARQTATPGDVQALFAPFWEAWNIVHEQYVDQPVDDVKLMEGAIRGMMEALGDEHSTYMDPKTYDQANTDLSGEYEGIGAYVDTGGDYLTITSPIPGSPAEAAGLRPGDQIIAIDGEDMTGVDPEVARQRVLGPAGSIVRLTISREGEAQPLEFEVKRGKITIESVTGKMLEGKIAYIQLTTFGDNTTNELKETLKDLMAQNPRGIILDLRYNGGGYLQTSVEVASQFLADGVVLYEQYGDGRKNTFDVLPGGLATDTKIPMVVLINEGSASASEIVAGALQDQERALLVGVTSYGKGSVQNWIPLDGNSGAVRVTIARWKTPDDRTIEGQGLEPDVYVAITEADYDQQKDPQLDAAVAALLALLEGSPVPTSMPTPLPTSLPGAVPTPTP